MMASLGSWTLSIMDERSTRSSRVMSTTTLPPPKLADRDEQLKAFLGYTPEQLLALLDDALAVLRDHQPLTRATGAAHAAAGAGEREARRRHGEDARCGVL